MIGQPIWRIELGDYVSACAIDPGGDLIAVGSLAGEGLVVDAATGTPVAKLAEHPMGILACAWERSGTRLAVGGQDGVVRLVDRGLDEQAVIETGGWVNRLAWSPAGDVLAIATGREVLITDADGNVTHRYPKCASTVTDLDWVPRSTIVGATAYGALSWFDVSTPALEPATTFEWKGSLLGIAIHPNARWACAGSQDNTIHLWKMWSGDELSMSGYPAKVERLAFSPEGQWLAAGCLGGLTVWDFSGTGPSGRAPAPGDAHERHIEAIAWQRDGGRLITGCAGGRLNLWRRPRKPKGTMRPLDTDDGIAGISQLRWPRLDALFVGRADGTLERRRVGG
jgi:WD40 repeat protein